MSYITMLLADHVPQVKAKFSFEQLHFVPDVRCLIQHAFYLEDAFLKFMDRVSPGHSYVPSKPTHTLQFLYLDSLHVSQQISVRPLSPFLF